MAHFTGVLDCDGRFGFKRNGVQVVDHWLGTDRTGPTTTPNYFDAGTYCGTYLDSPATTSTCTYQFTVFATGCSTICYINRDVSGSANNGRCGVTLMEISG